MSTRYVYDIYSVTGESTSITSNLILQTNYYYETLTADLVASYEASLYTNPNGDVVYSFNKPYGADGFPLTRDTDTADSAKSYKQRVADYKYGIIDISDSSGSGVTKLSNLIESTSNTGVFWLAKVKKGYIQIVSTDDNTGNFEPELVDKKPFRVYGGKLVKGSYLQKDTAASQLSVGVVKFMQGTAINQFRYREYVGTDNVDPSDVFYSKTDLYPGESVTISVTPRTPTYGGTISYQYQYSIDGGSSWTNIGGKTTSTSVTITIPETAKQFQARALASDNYGFTSTTYVYGPDMGVSQLKGYFTLNVLSLALKKGYCIIDSTVRDLAKGYVTIGGIWKKLF